MLSVKFIAAITALVACDVAFAGGLGKLSLPYISHITGNPQDVVPASQPGGGLALIGGGGDVDSAFEFMIQRSGGGGDFVVIRTSDSDAYNPYIFAMGGVDSVETLVLPSRAAASHPYVVARIRGAEALFIAGGDQSTYVNNWKDTVIEDAINELARRHVPVGGTSAGLAVLGQFVYSAQRESITSSTALANPYDSSLTLDRDFLNLPYLSNVITDSHFDARDRMGRFLAFIGRLRQDDWSSTQVHGLAVSEQTALAVETFGTSAGFGSVHGIGAVYALTSPFAKPEVCKVGTPLTFKGVRVQKLVSGESFDLRTWTVTSAAQKAYELSVERGVIASSIGRIY